MASVSETGHAKNVANFKNLISICSGLGPAWQPASADIQITALEAALAKATAVLKTISSGQALLTKAVAEKEAAFRPLNKIITKVINSYASCGATAIEVNRATTIARKITSAGTPAIKKDAAGNTLGRVSQSQLSEDMRIKNLDELIEILTASVEYAPREEELKITSLQALSENLRNLVNKADVAADPVTKALQSRNEILYKETSGLVTLAKNAKKYALSLLGSQSALYKKINSLNFKTIKPRGKK